MPKEADLDDTELARRIAGELSERQAEEIVLLDISAISGFADFFVLATANSPRQFEALAQAVEDADPSMHPRREGTPHSGWQLFDFGNVIVHIFGRVERQHYDLEGLWSAGRQLLRIE